MKAALGALFFIILAYSGWDYYTFLTDPLSELGQKRAQFAQKTVDIVEKEKKLAAAKDFFRNLEKKREELRALSNELATMKSTLTETPDPPAFVKLISNAAKKVGLAITSLSPLQSETKKYYIEQPFDLAFQGVYVQLIAFLDRLSQAERIVRVDDFTVRPRGTASRASRFVDLEGTIKVRSYVYLGTQEDEVANQGGSDKLKAATPNSAGGAR